MKSPESWIALVLAFALLSYYVHVVNLLVERGEHLRENQRSEANKPRQRTPVQRKLPQVDIALR